VTDLRFDLSPLPLIGQWVAVTGGSKGIGEGISLRLLAGGANVVLIARDAHDLERAATAARERATHGQEVHTITADVANRASVHTLFDVLHNVVPRLDHFVANAGTGRVTPFLDLDDAEVDEIVALNFTGTIQCMQLAARMIAEHPVDNSCIVVVSSVRALGAIPGRLIYSATKAGVNQAARVAAAELAPMGIRVNIVSPGITETPLTARHPGPFAEAVRGVPMGRAALPRDLAEAAYFLCTPAARFVTGVNLPVDGGESLG
jgi:3-oxoacyl-[acyl-carrier protein] reductase